MKSRVLVALLLLIAACSPDPIDMIEWHGHRGARGELPENTIPAFKLALDQDMQYLEMDVVIAADKQVVVSHEPYMNGEICFNPAGQGISEAEEKGYNIFLMNYAEVSLFDCGKKPHPEFPDQEKMKVTKPLLKAVIDTAEKYAAETNREEPLYNIEIKSRPEWENYYHPKVSVFTDLVMDVIRRAGVGQRSVIQSFDKRVLQYMREEYPDISLALLEADSLAPQVHLDSLGFIPEIYSCNYTKVNEELVEFCEQKEMKLIPWTVNEPVEMKHLIKLGVDGIITDYPSRVHQLDFSH